jgi:benzoate membrane transport protein
MPLERPDSRPPGLRRILADSGVPYAASAVVAFLFAASGPVAIILSVGAHGGLSESDIASWLFAAFSLNSVISIAFSLAYRQPLVFLWSIPGAVLVGPALGHLTFAEVIGAFLATGVLMALLGLSGWVRRAMDVVPMPIVMAMVAGVFLRFGVDLVLAFRGALWIALPMTVAFFLTTILKLERYLPPLIAALTVGGVAIALLGAFNAPPGALFAFASPNFYMPKFSWAAMVELVVPLAITVLAVQNAQGIAILATNGHKAPVNAITAACGVGSIVTGFFGAVSTCLTGPVNAVLSSAGGKVEAICRRALLLPARDCVRAPRAILHAAAARHAAGIHRHSRWSGHASCAADGVHRFLRRALQLWRTRLFPRYGCRCADLQHRCAVLGLGVRAFGGLAPRAAEARIGT